MRRYFILVGVNEYDTSLIPDLRGCHDDVLDYLGSLWVADAPMHQVVALTSRGMRRPTAELALGSAEGRRHWRSGLPKRGAVNLERVRFGSATRANILHHLREVFEQAAADHDRGRGAVIVFAFSGQAQRGLDGELHLCPSDATWDPTTQIRYSDIVDLLEAIAPEATLTAVLDTCYSGLAAPVGNTSGIRTNDLVLASAAEAEQVRERFLGGRWRGAFTWGLLRLIEQWDVDPSGSAAGLRVSYTELMARAAALLSAIGVPCMPQIRGDLADDPVALASRLGQVLGIDAGETSATPTRQGAARQFDGGICGIAYDVESDDESFPTGQLVVVGPTQTTSPPPAVTVGSFERVWWSFDPAAYESAGIAFRLVPRSAPLPPGVIWARDHYNAPLDPVAGGPPTDPGFEVRQAGDPVGYAFMGANDMTFWIRYNDAEMVWSTRRMVGNAAYELAYVGSGARQPGAYLRGHDT